ncbi:hypothetical protein KSF78_0008272 [Schistosoma japonicum]|nr:hypothetical protein KSF78_0008272 [Schistosoma japonicum]
MCNITSTTTTTKKIMWKLLFIGILFTSICHINFSEVNLLIMSVNGFVHFNQLHVPEQHSSLRQQKYPPARHALHFPLNAVLKAHDKGSQHGENTVFEQSSFNFRQSTKKRC